MAIGFEEIAKDTPRLSVSALDSDEARTITGTVCLDGPDTYAELETSELLDANESDEGWFDVNLLGPQQQSILLHNALVTQFGKTGQDNLPWRYKLFPNKVVIDSHHLTNDYKVKKLCFRVEGLKHFFQYDQIEWHHSPNMQTAIRDFLVEHREPSVGEGSKDPAWGLERSYDFLDPSELYVIHKDQPPLVVTTNGDEISFDYGVSSIGAGGHQLRLEMDARITITFAEPKELDDAIMASLPVRRLFNQLSFRDLPLIGMGASGGNGPNLLYAKIYLPDASTLRNKDPDAEPFRSSEAPLARWQHRNELRGVIQNWLDKNTSAERRRFREFVDLVLRRKDSTTYYQQLATLCAAIDCLPELSSRERIDPNKLQAMADAAQLAGSARGVNFTNQRIKGTLGIMGNTTLKERISLLFSIVAPDTSEDLQDKLRKHISRFRTIAAHGAASDDLRQPILPAVCEALLSLCVLFDLQDSGFNRQAGTSVEEFRPMTTLKDALYFIGRDGVPDRNWKVRFQTR